METHQQQGLFYLGHRGTQVRHHERRCHSKHHAGRREPHPPVTLLLLLARRCRKAIEHIPLSPRLGKQLWMQAIQLIQLLLCKLTIADKLLVVRLR